MDQSEYSLIQTSQITETIKPNPISTSSSTILGIVLTGCVNTSLEEKDRSKLPEPGGSCYNLLFLSDSEINGVPAPSVCVNLEDFDSSPTPQADIFYEAIRTDDQINQGQRFVL